MPCDPVTLATYLAGHASFLSPFTLSRRLIAIGRAHDILGHPNPCRSAVVKSTMRGIFRVHGRVQRQVKPLLPNDILSMLPLMVGRSGLRDRALILIGFAGAFRRSELVAIRFEHIKFVREGLTIFIPRAKTDQLRQGRRIGIPHGKIPGCPVQAMATWLERSAIESGPVFRAVSKSNKIANSALSPQSVANIIKRYAERIGLSGGDYSGQSLRAGFITHASEAKIPTWKIRQQTGHRSDAMLQRYIRDVDLFTLLDQR